MSAEHEPTTQVPGSCFCGAVKFEIELPTVFCGHCHCTMCQRVHGAGYVTWIAIPYTRFRMTGGNEHLKVHHSSAHGRRSFCDECGSSLFCESTHHPEIIDIVLANLDGQIDREPQAHYYFSDRVEWIGAVDNLPRFGGESGTEPLEE
jgi:hypothetical protein